MLTIFTMGGTLDKVYFDANSAFAVGEPQVASLLSEANIDMDYHIEPLLRKDSLELTDEDRAGVADQVAATSHSRILITHGTDTMTATAATLATRSLADKTIVLVGAMQPALMRRSDAPFNLGFALATVQLLSPGIYIAMNGRIFDHDNVTKNSDKSRFECLR